MPRRFLTRKQGAALVDELRARAEKSKAAAERDAATATFAEEAALAQRVVTRRADEIQRRIDDDARWTAERAAIGARLDVAQRNAFDLSDRIENARKAVDAALQSGDVDSASAHGMAVGSMQLTLGRAQALVQQLQQDLHGVPQGDATDDERKQVPLLRAIALSPEQSHQFVVPTLKVDEAAELRALGRRVARAEREGRFFRNTPTPIRDMRHA